jgi:hypothetical protein
MIRLSSTRSVGGNLARPFKAGIWEFRFGRRGTTIRPSVDRGDAINYLFNSEGEIIYLPPSLAERA